MPNKTHAFPLFIFVLLDKKIISCLGMAGVHDGIFESLCHFFVDDDVAVQLPQLHCKGMKSLAIICARR